MRLRNFIFRFQSNRVREQRERERERFERQRERKFESKKKERNFVRGDEVALVTIEMASAIPAGLG